MERAELAARLVEAEEQVRDALLRDHRAELNTPLAYVLKDICLDGWSSDPARSLAASATLQKISGLQSDPEIRSLSLWAKGIAALIHGDMSGAITTLDEARHGFLALN